jgi:hypothetical protein
MQCELHEAFSIKPKLALEHEIISTAVQQSKIRSIDLLVW